MTAAGPPENAALRERFLSLPPERRRIVQERLVDHALARWQAFAKHAGQIAYREAVVGTDQVVDARLPEDALAAARSGTGISEVDRRYGEPLAALQDDDLQLPDTAAFAYYAIYNYFRKYGRRDDVDDWLIVQQACAAEDDDREGVQALDRAIEAALRPPPRP